jgi:hypothetical protein
MPFATNVSFAFGDTKNLIKLSLRMALAPPGARADRAAAKIVAGGLSILRRDQAIRAGSRGERER